MESYRGLNLDANFKRLFENTVMLLGHVYETAYAYNKITKEEFGIFKFDNDPTCGLIGKNNDWCLVGGDVLVLKTWFDNSLRFIGNLKNIYEIRPIDNYKTHILIDPWLEQSSIWQLDIDPLKPTRPVNIFKVRDFGDYIDKPYTEQVKW